MAFSALKIAGASLLAASAARAQVLAPPNDIIFPSSESAFNPLIFSGGNTPWVAGPNQFGISSEVPEGCTVQQAAYVVRHGSRFPDPGSYNSWVAIQQKIQAAVKSGNFSAIDSLSFIPGWSPVLTNPTLQMSQESLTGWKEAHDLGYQLRARYPDFYQDGNPYYVWANQYASPINESRVVQTAQAFMQGYLYLYADTFGKVVSVNSTGAPDAVGNSLGPSDSCPLYAATASGGSNVTDWDSVWTPAALERINAMVTGNLTFDESDITFFPYLCAYESQIQGKLSPWCGVFNETELRAYEYSQDLSYFYSVGPGSVGPAQKVFLPFLDGLMSLLSEGPGQQGTGPNGTTFTVPNLIMAFLNDDQIAEMTSAMGFFDAEGLLPIDHIPDNYLFKVSNFITMRGTVAFEVLNCEASAPMPSTTSTPATSTQMTSTASSPPRSMTGASGFTTSTITVTETVGDCTLPTPTTVPWGSFKDKRDSSNSTYIRFRFNDAVWPFPSCQDGPGSSCLLSDYASYIHEKSEAAGNFIDYCNVTIAGHPSTVANGASFFTDLTLDYLTFVKP